MINILMIEDNAGDARLVREILSEDQSGEEYDLYHVVRVNDAIERLKGGNRVDVILSDISLPDSEGMETFQMLKKVAADLPVIFFTGTHDESLALDALQKGAQDYLIKGQFTSDNLIRVIRYAIERKRYTLDLEIAKSRARRLRQKTKLLRERSQQLEALNEAKDDFISIASHQLRTPATGVKQYLGMILEGFVGKVPENFKKYLQTAFDSNERQLTIVNDLLRVAQVDSNNVSLHIEPVDVVAMIRDVVEAQMARAKNNDQKLSFQTESKVLKIKGDAKNIRMVIENLLDNAMKYTPAGKAVCIKLDKDKQNAIISVIDEGVGIDKSDMDKLFLKFTRIDNPLSNIVGGTGLGLYWVKKMLDMQQGSITVESKLDHGTTFRVYMPLSKRRS